MQRLPYHICQPIYEMLDISFHPEQMDIIKQDDRFPVIGGGERGGKTFTTAAILLPHVVLLPEVKPSLFYDDDGELLFDPASDKPRNPHFILFGPTYREPRQEFELLEGWLRKLELLDGRSVSKPKDGQWQLITNDGVVVQTWSLDDQSNVRAVSPEGSAVCECGQAGYLGVERIQGRISGTTGFIVYSGTMEDSQQWYQDWMLMGQRANHLDIVSYSLPAFTNRHLFPGGRLDPEILRLEKVYPEDVFAMRVMAEPRPPKGRVLPEVVPAHIQRVNVPDDAKYEFWIDPGYASAYAILFVAMWVDPKDGMKRFHCVDELYEQGLTTDAIIELVKRTPYWPKINSGVIDIASQTHGQGTESALEKWRKLTGKQFNMRYWGQDALIERVRSSFKEGRVTIDPRCRGLIAECGLGDPVFPDMHPWKYLRDKDGRITSEKPIDRWNHSAKALGYGLLHHLGQVERVGGVKNFNRLRQNVPSRNILTSHYQPRWDKAA